MRQRRIPRPLRRLDPRAPGAGRPLPDRAREQHARRRTLGHPPAGRRGGEAPAGPAGAALGMDLGHARGLTDGRSGRRATARGSRPMPSARTPRPTRSSGSPARPRRPLPSGPAFARLKTNNELWLSSGLSGRYDLDPERATIKPAWTLREAGPALAPVQATERLAVLTQQYSDGPGVALWGVDPTNGAIAWRTVLGVPWPVDPTPSADGQGIDTIAANGRPLTIPRSQLAKGGFVEQALPKPGDFSPAPRPLERLEVRRADRARPRRRRQLPPRARGVRRGRLPPDRPPRPAGRPPINTWGRMPSSRPPGAGPT